jgi:hypothetical protein
MHKLKLDVEALTVESFSPSPARAAYGTVLGNSRTADLESTCAGPECLGLTWYYAPSCDGAASCYQECQEAEKKDHFINDTDICSEHCTGFGCPP